MSRGGIGSGSGRYLLVGGWSQLASLLRKGYCTCRLRGRARVCVCVRVRVCVCERVSEGIRLHSLIFPFFSFFLLEASWWMWIFFF